MDYQQLGNTGVFVSRLCLGTMTFGGAGTMFEAIGALQQKESDELVSRSIDAGINFFDTANVYASGESETQLGKALGGRRKDIILATKVFGRVGDGPNETGLSRLHILRAIEDSLTRLNTDYIDLYQIHGFDRITPLEETLETLDDLVHQGKVRYIGCSNLAAWQIMKSLGISAAGHLQKFVSVQAYYSIAGRELEREIVPLLNDQKLGLLPWSPLAGGFLTGKFTRSGASDSDARRTKFNFPPVNVEKAYEIVDVMREVAARHQAASSEVTIAQVALAWLLHQPFVTSIIIGAKNGKQLEDNLGAVGLKLSEEDLLQLNKISELSPEYPGWMLNMPSTRLPGEKRDWSRVAKPAAAKS